MLEVHASIPSENKLIERNYEELLACRFVGTCRNLYMYKEFLMKSGTSINFFHLQYNDNFSRMIREGTWVGDSLLCHFMRPTLAATELIVYERFCVFTFFLLILLVICSGVLISSTEADFCF